MIRYSASGRNWTYRPYLPLQKPHSVGEILSVDGWKIEVVHCNHNEVQPTKVEVENIEVYLSALLPREETGK